MYKNNYIIYFILNEYSIKAASCYPVQLLVVIPLL